MIAQEESNAYSPNKTEVLLVEDCETSQFLFQVRLECANISNDLTVKGNGQEAINYLLQNFQDTSNKNVVIFLDLNMPILDGFEFLEKLERIPRVSPYIIFIYSSSDDFRDIQKAYQYNIAGYFTKGSVKDTDEMFQMVKSYLKLNRMPL